MLSRQGELHPLGDVYRMVPDTFKILRNHQKVKTNFTIFRIFPQHGRQFCLYPGKQGVHLVVIGHDGPGQVYIAADKGRHGVRDHTAGGRGHFRDVALALGLGIGDVAQGFGNIRRLVADALHIGDHLQGRRDHPQIPGHRLLLQQQLHAQALNIPLLLVDPDLQGADFLGFGRAVPGQGVGHQADGLLTQSAHGDQFHMKLIQLLIKSCPHYPNLPVM